MSTHPFTHLFYLDDAPRGELRGHIRKMLVDVILNGQHPTDTPLPSSRNLATQLGVARTTITAVYSNLVAEGFLIAKERNGYFVNPEFQPAHPIVNDVPLDDFNEAAPDWRDRIHVRPSGQVNISKPLDWQSYPFPFICGQIDSNYFPVREWRECSRTALSISSVKKWVSDNIAEDDPELVEHVRTRLLPRRGVSARAEEILITVGSQNALYMLSRVLVNKETTIGFERPGYPDARNVFQLRTENVRHIPVDEDGLTVCDELADCDYVYVTPSHQVPTTVTMPLLRRKNLLEYAEENDIVILEDDYESEVNFDSTALPALKSMDRSGRVIYFSSISKTLAPGLRVGFLVAPPDVINEVRALRRLMLRHAPTDTQRTLSLFLAQGSYDSLVGKLKKVYEQRWRTLMRALDECMPSCRLTSAHGGSSVWVQGPEGLDAAELTIRAREHGVLIEPGDVYFPDNQKRCRWFRLGFSAIAAEKIPQGIEELGKLLDH